MVSRRLVLPEETTEAELDAVIDELNADDTVDGMLVQLPVPEQLSEVRIANRIHPDKDVDGFAPVNLGRLIRGEPGSVSCTPPGSCGCSTGPASRSRAPTPSWWGAA